MWSAATGVVIPGKFRLVELCEENWELHPHWNNINLWLAFWDISCGPLQVQSCAISSTSPSPYQFSGTLSTLGGEASSLHTTADRHKIWGDRSAGRNNRAGVSLQDGHQICKHKHKDMNNRLPVFMKKREVKTAYFVPTSCCKFQKLDHSSLHGICNQLRYQPLASICNSSLVFEGRRNGASSTVPEQNQSSILQKQPTPLLFWSCRADTVTIKLPFSSEQCGKYRGKRCFLRSSGGNCKVIAVQLVHYKILVFTNHSVYLDPWMVIWVQLYLRSTPPTAWVAISFCVLLHQLCICIARDFFRLKVIKLHLHSRLCMVSLISPIHL